MPKHVIELSIDPNGNLVLSDGGTTNVGNVINRKVYWEITDSKIDSIKIIGKNSDGPFDDPANTKYDTKVEVRVKLLAHTGDWKYSINWKDKATHTEHHYDPIISIKPIDSSLTLFIILIVGIVSIPLLLFRRNQIRRKRNSK